MSPPARPKPLSRSILWIPRSWDGGEVPAGSEIDLFVWQAALREIRVHLSTPEGREGYGMLAGRLYHCPVSGTSYLAVEEAHPASHPAPQGDDAAAIARFREIWLAVSMRVGREERTLVGWYHAHPRLGVSFSKSDQRLHVAHFPNRWQCALVLTSDSPPEGGFFQRDSRSGAFQSTLAPFYEVVSRQAASSGEPLVSWIGWDNYQPDRETVDPPRQRRRAAAFELVTHDAREMADRAAQADEALRELGGGAGGYASEGATPAPPAASGDGAERAGAKGDAMGGVDDVVELGRATTEVLGAEIGGAPAPPVIVPLSRRKPGHGHRRRVGPWAAAVLALAAAALSVAILTDRINFEAIGREVGLELSAPAQTVNETPAAAQTIAGGQAGAVPMARGQDPGPPSANDGADAGIQLGDAADALQERIDGYRRIRGVGESPPDCASLSNASGDVERAAVQLARAIAAASGEAEHDETQALTSAVEVIRTDYAEACAGE